MIAETTETGVVLVVDDDEGLRTTLVEVLQAAGFEAFGFPSANDLLEHGACRRPACMVLDLHLPGLNGLELQQELLRDDQQVPIIFYSGQGDIESSVRAMKAGALDFLQKPVDPAELLAAVRGALSRDSEALAERAELKELEQRFSGLTRRERQVLAEVVGGLSNKQIAARLGVGEKTIKVHRAGAIAKMRASSLPELVRMAGKLGISDSE
ncbi:MAG: response regulator [Thermoanaerobaculia bacterium]